jgi:GPI inositol-deacylase
MSRVLPVLVAIFSILSVVFLYRATSESAISLSPQGCRMSYMSPSYLVQSQFDTSWTPLAKRYSLLLYREVGWEHNEVSRIQSRLSLPHEPSSSVASQSFSYPEMLGLPARFVQ